MRRFEKLKEQLNSLGFTGNGYDHIDMTDMELREALGVNFTEWYLEKNENDITTYFRGFDNTEEVTISVFDGKITNISIEE